MTRPYWVMVRRVLRPAWMFWIACAGVLAGCSDADRSSSAPPKPSFPGVKLTVGALGDPAILAGLAAERGEWMASRGGEITIQEQAVQGPDHLSEVDLLIFPGQELGTLVDADALEMIPNQVVLPVRTADDEAGARAAPRRRQRSLPTRSSTWTSRRRFASR